jgi:hypothetical protein
MAVILGPVRISQIAAAPPRCHLGQDGDGDLRRADGTDA